MSNKSPAQLRAEARVRRLLKERDLLGTARADALEVRRRLERLRQVRAHTVAAVAARRAGLPINPQPELTWLLFDTDPNQKERTR